ncbi:DUF3558 family protein [Saccharopolyspora gloriosae]|uniref:DUF3558 family protein n=1 Tax=Saccharopolyspora gloriosae TaxID=455344 RepID=UPI001FB75129|nr:DUF3558 family protein [Saccharopolyspora gloriosae]
MRRPTISAAVLVPALAVVLAGCTSGGPPPAPSSTPTTSGSDQAEPETVTPSITREVPPERRQDLAGASAEQLCGLINVDELGRFGYAVRPGVAREIGFDPPVRGCRFEAQSGVRSILIASQPQEYAGLGEDEVRLGEVPGTKTLRANECSVFAGVGRGTLQVTVQSAEADSDECDAAQGIAQYVLSAVD